MSDMTFNKVWTEMEGICQRADARRPGNSYFQVINVTFLSLLGILIIISSFKHNYLEMYFYITIYITVHRNPLVVKIIIWICIIIFFVFYLENTSPYTCPGIHVIHVLSYIVEAKQFKDHFTGQKCYDKNSTTGKRSQWSPWIWLLFIIAVYDNNSLKGFSYVRSCKACLYLLKHICVTKSKRLVSNVIHNNMNDNMCVID